MKAIEIIEAIEKVAPLHLAASWDNSGMQVAAKEADVNCLALCLDPTPQSVQEAVALGAQLLVSHHPLLMQARLPATCDHYHQVLELLFKNDMALYAAHTSLDINPAGPVGWLAAILELQNTEVLEVTGQMPQGSPCGFGLVGDLPAPLTVEALVRLLGMHIDMRTAFFCGAAPASVRRVAYCTGSGSSLAALAKEKGAELFITGDVKYHSALESPLCILDVGHHSLEEEMMRRMALDLAREMPELRVAFIASQSPMRPALA